MWYLVESGPEESLDEDLNSCSNQENTGSRLQILGFGLQNNPMWVIFPGKQEKVTPVKVKDCFVYRAPHIVVWLKIWGVLTVILSQVSGRISGLHFYSTCYLIWKKANRTNQSKKLANWCPVNGVVGSASCPLFGTMFLSEAVTSLSATVNYDVTWLGQETDLASNFPTNCYTRGCIMFPIAKCLNIQLLM